MRLYKTRLVTDGVVIQEGYIGAENAVEAIELSIEQGQIIVPYGFAGYGIATDCNNVVFKIDIGFEG